MGLLKHLLFWPVTGPTFLTEFSFRKLEDALRSELTDDSGVREELMELQLRLELEEIDDAEYTVREAELMAKLRDIRAWREEFGMPAAGGIVRVQQSEDDPREEERQGWSPSSSPGSTPDSSSS